MAAITQAARSVSWPVGAGICSICTHKSAIRVCASAKLQVASATWDGKFHRCCAIVFPPRVKKVTEIR